LRMENGEWRIENGELRIENGEWRMESGEWRMENGNHPVFFEATPPQRGINAGKMPTIPVSKKNKDKGVEMKSVLYSTQNVKKAQNVLKDVCRTKSGDLVVLYGYTGTGKSQYAKKNFAQKDWGYYRIQSVESGRSFAMEIYQRLHYLYTGSHIHASGHASTLVKKSIDLWQEINYIRANQGQLPLVFFVDEVNNAIKRRTWDILEIMRDFRDTAEAKIVLIGEENTRAKIEKYDSHYSGRVTNWCNFEIPSQEDIVGVITSSMEVEATPGVYKMMIAKMGGSLHALERYIKLCESVANQYNLALMDIESIKKYKIEFR